MDYGIIIKTATLAFPFIAFLITIPFVLSQYRTYGSISFFKTVILYLFLYYLICAYFLVILPLPKISEVKALTTPRVQLIPFTFIADFIKDTSFTLNNFSTYFKAIKESCFFVPLYNILLTIPFGMFLRYYRKCDLKKTTYYSFLLSLFFELTQLTGLYFIYPRGYRLFDVDDLLLNTFGGFLGYFMCAPFLKILPSIDQVNLSAKEKGRVISGFRRTTAALLDGFIVLLLELITSIFSPNFLSFVIVILIYYCVIPLIINHTLGQSFLKIKVVDLNEKINKWRLAFRMILFFLFYFEIPISYVLCISYLKDEMIKEICILSGIGIFSFFIILSFLRFVFTSRPLLYEKLSKTKLASTIPFEEKEAQDEKNY